MTFQTSTLSQALVMALGLGCAAMANAQSTIKTNSNWEFYGRAHMSVDQLNDGAKYNRLNLSSNSSHLGFRGDKSFGDFKGIWQIEQEILFNKTSDTSNSQDDKNRLATRDTFVGLEGGFGNVKFGKFDTPFKVARGPANLFGDQVGDMRNITRAGAKFDERPDNIIQYQSPIMNGLRLSLAYAPHEGVKAESTNGNDAQKTVTSMSVTYNAGALSAALAGEGYGADAKDGKRDAMRLALAYQATGDFKVVAFYQEANYVTTTTPAVDEGSKVTGVGAEYKLTPTMFVRAQSFNRNANKANANSVMNTVGLERVLDKQLRVYVNYAAVDNQANAKIVPWVEGRSANQAGTNGADGNGLSVGLRFDF